MLMYYIILYSGCILEYRDKPTSHSLTNFYTHGNNLIPIYYIRPTHLQHELAVTDFSKKSLNLTVLAKQKYTICTNILRIDIEIKIVTK